MLLTDLLVDLRSVDVVTDRNNIRKLLSVVEPGIERNGAEDFAINIEVVNLRRASQVWHWREALGM